MKQRKTIWLVLIALTISYILVCLALRIWQNHLIFFPDYVVDRTPQDVGLQYEEVKIPSAKRASGIEQETIYGWWIPATRSEAKVLLYLYGNSGNISGANLRKATRFHRLGFSVLLIDYRGYGRSRGNFPTEASVYQDARSAWDYLVEKRRIKPQNILLYGYSLGGAVAIDLAVNRSQTGGTIVEGTFTSMQHMAEYQKIYKFLPLNLIVTQKFDSINKIAGLKMPILIIHGQIDRTVPSFVGQILYNTAKQPKKIWLVPNAGHNNLSDIAEKTYIETIQNFLNSLPDKTDNEIDQATLND
jgi:uncharacterized protein